MTDKGGAAPVAPAPAVAAVTRVGTKLTRSHRYFAIERTYGRAGGSPWRFPVIASPDLS
jgi:hypothetical protein